MAKEKEKETDRPEGESRALVDLQKQLSEWGIDKSSSVKLPGGVVGRSTWVLIAACVSVGGTGAAVAPFNPYVAGTLGVGLLALLCIMMNRILDYATKNPVTSLLEGAELLTYHREKQAAQAAKGRSRISSKPKDSADDPNAVPVDVRVIDAPDSPAAKPALPAPPEKEGE